MTKVNKYLLKITDVQILKLPEQAKVLSVLEQHACVALYVLEDSDCPANDLYTVRIVGTTYEIPDMTGFVFVGTCLIHQGLTTTHVFVRKEASE